MKEKTTYKEPSSYFNADMKKAAKAWEEKQKQQTQKNESMGPKGKK